MKLIFSFFILLITFSNCFGETKVIKDISYKNTDNDKNKLDLFIPTSVKNFKTLIFVHGGCWRSQDKSQYSFVGEYFAANGIATAVINYRLTPEVYFPDNAKDVANACKWVISNIKKYGGGDEIYLSGHSAGAHLITMVASNKKYEISGIKGIIAISGVYSINRFIEIGGLIDTFKFTLNKDASPKNYVSGDLPKFLVVYSQFELVSLGWQAVSYNKKLKQAGVETDLLKVNWSHHCNIPKKIFKYQSKYGDKILSFINN